MSARRLVAGVLAMMLGAAVLSILPSSPQASAAPAEGDSAVTVSGKGDFADLKVTVSQTKNLINQTVKVTWTGGKPTLGQTSFFINYLQIMQCWGDDPAGPDRTQCQFGASTTKDGGRWVKGRQVTTDLTDDNEKLKPSGDVILAHVPFWAVGTDKPTGPAPNGRNDFFDSLVTNEIPLARTHGDGKGEEFFEVETVRQAAGLGCGAPVVTGGSTTGRRCWLVIVPRNNKEVNGEERTGLGSGSQLESSPLSQSNWNHRIVIPLEFQPVGQACQLGAPERPVVGHEMVLDAVSSWQPALCAGGRTLFSYTQLPDDVARNQVLDGRLALVNDPIPAEAVLADHPLVYAPVGLSGLVFAFNINYQPDPEHRSDGDLALSGRRFTSMKLTPRLVAKLLTQSYQESVALPSEEMKNNPIGLLFDPEFLELNTDYQGFVFRGQPVPDALVQLNGADVTSQLWSWVKADPDASAFLAGAPDKFGMRVNPKNQNLTLPTSTFPRNDQSCKEDPDSEGNIPLKNCSTDLHPFSKDMHDAGRAASRGDTQGKKAVVSNGIVTTQNIERQGPGHQGLIAVVDAATAIRYGLPTAQIRNAAGEFVAPIPESLLAGAAALKPTSVPDVLVGDPGTPDPTAYPLTSLSYAVTSPSTLDSAAGKDYAAFLRYAGGPGQQQGLGPGLLPFGMVPLPDSLRAKTMAAAAAIETQTSRTPSRSPAPSPTITAAVPTQNPTGGPGTPAPTSSATPPSASGRPAVMPVTFQGVAPPASTPGKPQKPAVGTRRTSWLSMPTVGLFLLVTLIVGVAAAVSSGLMQRLSGRLRHRLRKEVVPTEQ